MLDKIVENSLAIVIFTWFLVSFCMGIYEIYTAIKSGGFSHWAGGILLLLNSSISFLIIYLLASCVRGYNK